VVLLQFNRKSELTYEELKAATNIPEKDLKNALKYMCNPKTKIIDKENMKKPDFTPQEKAKLTENYTNANIRVNYIPPSVETPDKTQDGPGGDSKKPDAER